ncbi:putative ribonuclease H-like domain-containing protein [Tanacetum coccineum]
MVERFYTSAGNPVKEILLKLNLPDHRILKDGGKALMVIEGEVFNDFPRFVGALIVDFAVGSTVNLALKMKGDMIIEILNLNPTIDAMKREFLEPKSVEGASVLHQPEGVGSKRYHIVPFGEFNGVPIALVARSGAIPQTTAISNIKLLILKKEEYDIWDMEMEHYLEYIDNDAWKVIQNGNSKKRISTGKDGVIRILPLVTAAEIQAVEKERKAKNILLMAIPKEHMRRFHGMDYAKEIWEAIRTRFGGNANSKKMQKAVFKQQFEAFTISSSEGLEKGYDRFQQLLSQLEAHGAEVSTEDANHKFLRSLPPAWSNLAMTMRTKPDVDTLSIDDLYNNLRVFEQEIQGASKTSSSAQNVAFVSQSKSSTNKVKSGFTGAYSTCTPSTSSTNIPEKEVLAGFADEVIYSLFAKQSEDWDLLHEDLEQIDDLDIEEMDINWQIAMIAIRMKKFYKKTGRRVRVDGKAPVGFDKKKLECFNCHNTGHFARECTAKGTHDGKKKRDSFYQHQEAGKQEKNQMGLLTMDDGIVNWGEHTEDEETNHALMAISSSSEVSLCSKTCIDSYNTLKTLCDEQMNQLGDQEAQILAYSQAVKKLEAQLVTFQKQQLSLNEKLTFQANEIYEKDEKLKKYRRIGMKAVKEKEQLQKTLDSWKDSSKNLWRLINSGMSSNRSIGTSSEHSVDLESEISRVPSEVYMSTPKTTNEKGVSDPKSKEVEPSCVSHIKSPRQPIKDQATPKVNRKNWNAKMERELGEGYSFTKKKCFVCGSLSHLIKDCDYYEKKMAREAEFKKQRVFNTGNGVAKPVWTNANRVNHANQFVPRSVQLNTGRTNINSVRPNIRTNVNPVRPRVNTGSSNVNTVRSRQPVPNKTSNSFSPKRPQVNQFNQRGHFSKSYSSVRRPFAKTTAQMSHSHAVKGNWGSAVKTSAGYNWRNSNPNSNCDSGPTFIRTDHPLKNMVDRGIFYNECSGHMTGNKDQLEDFEEFNGGSITFGGSKGNISGKGKIRVGNLDFDSVSFMPDENQILLKVPRHHNMYSFDMKTPTPAKGFACLITKATSDESKLWHRRYFTTPIQCFKEKDEDDRLIVVPFSYNPKILAFRRELEEIALKHLGTVSENNSTSTPSVNTGSQTVNTGRLDPDDSPMPELEIFHNLQSEIEEEPKRLLKLYKMSVGFKPCKRVCYSIKLPTKLCLVFYLTQNEESLVTKWVYRNKRDERGVVVRYKATLVAQGYTQEEVLNYDEVFDMWRLEAIRDKKDIMLVQVYVDDIIFGSTKKSWCDEFEALLKMQISDEDKYVAEILKKFDLVNVKTTITPMETKVALTKDEEAIDVDVHLYISMIVTPRLHISQSPHSLTVIMVGPTLTGNPQQVVVNFLDKDLSHGNARNRDIVATSKTEVKL